MTLSGQASTRRAGLPWKTFPGQESAGGAWLFFYTICTHIIPHRHTTRLLHDFRMNFFARFLPKIFFTWARSIQFCGKNCVLKSKKYRKILSVLRHLAFRKLKSRAANGTGKTLDVYSKDRV